jgi:hypothetical protein
MAGAAEVIRAHAGVLRLEADRLRRMAFRIRMVGATVRWRSPAAEAFRSRVERRAGSLQCTAEAVHQAASALELHAAAIEAADVLEVEAVHLGAAHTAISHLLETVHGIARAPGDRWAPGVRG